MPRQPAPPPPPSKADGNETPPQGGVSSPRAMAGAEVGLRLVVAVMLMGGLGFALDRWLGSLPWLMLLGGVFGFASWIVSVARRPR